MFEKSHKMFLFAVSPSFLYALPDMFSFRIASFPSVFFYLGLELGLRLRPGLMFYFVSSSSFSYSPCLWSNHPSTVHLQTWYVLSSELIFLAHCVCLHQQIHYMIPSRFVTHLANPGEYTLLHSTHLSPSANVERCKTQDSRHDRQDIRYKISLRGPLYILLHRAFAISRKRVVAGKWSVHSLFFFMFFHCFISELRNLSLI